MAKKVIEKKKTEDKGTEKTLKFTKKQLIKSNKYIGKRDALNALLENEKTYTHKEVEKILNDFYKGGVK